MIVLYFLLNDPIFAGQHFSVHKALLAAHSSVFCTVLQDSSLSQVKILHLFHLLNVIHPLEAILFNFVHFSFQFFPISDHTEYKSRRSRVWIFFDHTRLHIHIETVCHAHKCRPIAFDRFISSNARGHWSLQ